MTKIKKDSLVTVISGAAKGKVGKVVRLDREKSRVVVEGVNVRKSAVRRSPDRPQGGMVEKECPIHLSNVMLQERFEARKAKRDAAVAAK